jgi:hypothetical protein
VSKSDSTGSKGTKDSKAGKKPTPKTASGTRAKKSTVALTSTQKATQADLLAAFLSVSRAQWPQDWFEGDTALELLEPFYNALLENCTDDEDDVDTRTVLELLAGMTGVFLSDYSQFYGEEKTLSVLRSFVSMTLRVYDERTQELNQ